jgi:hypothetical protein
VPLRWQFAGRGVTIMEQAGIEDRNGREVGCGEGGLGKER